MVVPVFQLADALVGDDEFGYGGVLVDGAGFVGGIDIEEGFENLAENAPVAEDDEGCSGRGDDLGDQQFGAVSRGEQMVVARVYFGDVGEAVEIDFGIGVVAPPVGFQGSFVKGDSIAADLR